MERARVAVSSLSDNSLTRLPQLVELLRQCISENTILCLSRLQAKLFAIVTACRQFGVKVFTKNRTATTAQYIVIVSDSSDTDSVASCLLIHSSFNVLSRLSPKDFFSQGCALDLTNYHVLILSAADLAYCFEQHILSFANICLLLFNECHLALIDDSCANLLENYKLLATESKEKLPLIMAVTTVLSTMYIEDSHKLELFLSDLATFFSARINVDRTMLSSKYSHDSKLKEQLIVCGQSIENVRSSLEEQLNRIIVPFTKMLSTIYPSLSSTDDCIQPDVIGAAKLSFLAVQTVGEILSELGPFCAAKMSENFIDQIDQHYSCNVPNADARKMLAVGSTTLREICQVVDIFYASNVVCLEDIIPLVPKKVMAFLQEFKKWMPNIDFKITPATTLPFDENKKKKSKDANSVDDDDDDDDDDSSDTDFSDDMSSDSTDDGGGKKGLGSDMPGCTPVDPSTFRRHRRQATIRMMKQIIDGITLSALVVVKTPFEAYSLAMLIDEICKYDADLFFLKVGHYASLSLQETSAKSLLLAPPARLFLKYQSNVLHRFRQRRLNVLVTTDLHGTSVTLPPINHVVRLSVPFTYESYIVSKSFCQTQNSVMTVVVDEKSADSTQTMLQVFRDTENVLLSHCVAPTLSPDLPCEASSSSVISSPNSEKNRSNGRPVNKDSALIQPFYPTGNPKDSAKVTADNAIMIINRYCAKLPSDVFTRLTSLLQIDTVPNTQAEMDTKTPGLSYRASITLPVISPLKSPISGALMPSPLLALKSAAVKACQELYQNCELDEKLNPVTFEVWKCEDLRQEEIQLEADSSTVKPSNTGVSVAKRKQTYGKKLADALVSGPLLFDSPPTQNGGSEITVANVTYTSPPCRLYQIKMKRVEAPLLTLVDRAYDNTCCPRHYGFISTDGPLPPLPIFPVFTRYCDLEVTFESLEDGIVFNAEELDLIRFFHRYVFHTILRIEKDVLFFQPEKSPIQVYVLPLTYEYADAKPKIDWEFIRSIKNFKPTVPGGLGTVYRRAGERFNWNRSLFEDAVVYRSYCGFVANDLYYVVNVRDDYSPKTPFPSDQYDDFVSYYEIKYHLMVTNTTQPLLDVDHTTAHLNMVLPRRCSGKLVPTTEEENAQRLWFVPELCGIHPFPASMWHKAACLPTIFYRLNCLLVANETLHMINNALGMPDLTDAIDGIITPKRSLLEYSQLRTHQQSAIAFQAADITHWLPSERLLDITFVKEPSRNVCSDCILALESVVLKTLWLYFKREPFPKDTDSPAERLTCLICHSVCITEFHAIAHLRHRHSWLYTQPWSFRAGATCPLCQEMTEALRLSHNQLQPCELPISAIHCSCASADVQGLCCRLSSQWDALRPKISYLSQSMCRPPNMCDVLTALTASNANDMFSYERLETVGDSFLKFTVTAYLYCSSPGTEEGKLTYMRSRQVCNLNLYYRGRSRDLAERMFVSKFEPSEAWLPPAYVCLRDTEVEKINDPSSVWKTAEEEAAAKKSHALTNGNGKHEEPAVVTNANNDVYTAAVTASTNEITNGDATKSENGEEVEKSENIADLPSPGTLQNGGRGGRGSGRGRGRRGRGRGRGRGGQLQSPKLKLEKSDDSDDSDEDGVDKGAKLPKSPQKDGITLHTHQSLSDKNIADCVEALIAAYLVTAGHQAALHVITWFGIKVLPISGSMEYGRPVLECVGKLPDPSPPLLPGADREALMNVYHCNNMQTFESLIGYHFRDKAYLAQSFCHASFDLFTKRRLTDSYQRLELLGDAILDYLITRHMYELHSHYSPGVLTDLRSALVNNNIFSSLAVRWSFHRFLLYASPGLFNVVVDFVNLHKQHGSDLDLEKLDELEESGEALECPKVLGDIFESVAGAIYLDSGLSLETVWLVYYRMLKPVIDEYTANIPKSPVRELLEREPETARFLRPERTVDGRVKVIVNVVDKGQFTGVGRNFRLAKNAAARRALRQIKSTSTN